MFVCVLERSRDLGGNSHRLVNRKLFLAVDPVAERLAFHVGHDVEQEAVRFARIVEREDMRVSQVRRRLDLSQEPEPVNDNGTLYGIN